MKVNPRFDFSEEGLDVSIRFSLLATPMDTNVPQTLFLLIVISQTQEIGFSFQGKELEKYG